MSASLGDMGMYLEAARIPLRLACRTKTGWPMVVSLWYLHRDGLLYCATQRSARIVAYLRDDARCAFEIAGDQPPYCGVRGQAYASIQESLGAEILKELLVRYQGGTDNDLARDLLAKSDKEVAILLEPKRVYTWDYSRRMAGIGDESLGDKICPEVQT